MTLSCGLDFGTSNSTLGRVGDNGAPQLLTLEAGQQTMPSVLFFGFEDDRIHYGRAAVAEYVTGADGRLMRSLKSVLGTALFADTTRVKARRLGFGEIIGTYVGELKRRAEAELGQRLTRVVMGRPVHFVDDDMEADKAAQGQLEAAVRAQGFDEIAFQFEPIAAALDYERQVSGEKLALIVDLGGGTSDFSLVRVSPERAGRGDRSDDILATAGVHIGGTDFDRLLAMSRVMPELGLGSRTLDGKRHLPVAPYNDLSTWHRINRLYDAKALRDLRSTMREAIESEKVETFAMLVEDRLGHRLIGAVEAAKIALSDEETVAFSFPVRERTIETAMSITHLGAALDGSIAKLERTIAETVQLAGVGTGDVDSLILTGGSTLVPAVANRLRALFPDAEVIRTDVLGSVGLGLALEARRIFGS
ncbi:Hsp70 family protein [Devosia sp. XJ19-1]|uniref:Hsp70 family protein n=1 Tax=Devosia ureilytica TaxID=2952754 RepID=A0A9Q4FRV5_9HYPH|nr:Hsp70 family protein [Devosia ureilytica]MCP8884263.1 Hsp70 family protein [Devosia ureilytica]MCP8887871.1 Hsp70 family protein [Devosia ureilytica]